MENRKIYYNGILVGSLWVFLESTFRYIIAMLPFNFVNVGMVIIPIAGLLMIFAYDKNKNKKTVYIACITAILVKFLVLVAFMILGTIHTMPSPSVVALLNSVLSIVIQGVCFSIVMYFYNGKVLSFIEISSLVTVLVISFRVVQYLLFSFGIGPVLLDFHHDFQFLNIIVYAIIKITIATYLVYSLYEKYELIIYFQDANKLYAITTFVAAFIVNCFVFFV